MTGQGVEKACITGSEDMRGGAVRLRSISTGPANVVLAYVPKRYTLVRRVHDHTTIHACSTFGCSYLPPHLPGPCLTCLSQRWQHLIAALLHQHLKRLPSGDGGRENMQAG